MGASVRPVATPDDAEFQAWKAKQPASAVPPAAPLTHDDAEFQAWKQKQRVGPGFAAEATAVAPDQASRRAAMAAQPPILSSGLPREIEQGATLGFGDEINAGVRSIGKETYADALANERGIIHAYEQAHPIVSTAAQIGGGIGTAAIGGAAARAVGLGAKVAAAPSTIGRIGRVVGRAATSATGIGAIAGAGTSDGDLGDRAVGAVKGGVAGTIIGAVGRRVIGADQSPNVTNAATDLVGDQPRGVELALPQAQRRIVGPRAAPDRGGRVVLRTITKGGQSIDDLRSAANAASTDKPITLADIGGEGAQQLAAGATTFPESGAATKVPKIIRGRAEAAGTRMSADMTDASGVQPVNPYELADKMKVAQQTQANQLYAEAYAKGAVPDETIQDMLKLPYFDDAYKFAKRLAKLDGRKLPERLVQVVEKGQAPAAPPGFSEEQWTAARAKLPDNEILNPPGKVTETTQTVPDVEALDLVKRGVDKQIQNNLGRGSIDDAAAVKLQERLGQFLKRVDAQVPEYAKARSMYAAGERMREALEAGRGAIKKEPRLIQQEIGALETPHEQGLYRYGLQDALNQTIAATRDGAPIAGKLAGSDFSRGQLAAIAKDAPAADELLKRAGEEHAMADANARILGGSNTMNKAGARNDIESEGLGLPSHLPVTPKAAVRFAWGRLVNYTKGLNAGTAEDVANRLMAGASSRQELLDQLDQLDVLRKKGQLTPAKTRAILKLPAAEQAARVVGPQK